MLMIARDRDYPELLEELRGKKVVIWTCNTCARLCNGMGGDEAAEKMAASLRRDGIDVKGVLSTSASCLRGKVRKSEDRSILDEADILLTMTCYIGSSNAGAIFKKDTLNPFVTLGPGYVEEDRSLYVYSQDKAEELSAEASRRGLKTDPFV